MNVSAELATVIDNFLPPYNRNNQLPSHKLRTLDAIQKCRTEYMGGHIEACTCCGKIRTTFNSCRNRHCPKCGAIDKEKWIINRELDLLPVRYFHVVFTIPDKLNMLFLNNQKVAYNLLFTTAWDVLKNFGCDKKWIGGRIGATAILHTWGQKLNYHPHLHFIIPAGALMANSKWKSSRNRGRFLFDVKQLSSVFRARLVENLRTSYRAGELKTRVPNTLFENKWVVYAKTPFGGPKQVINYLGRYTHRTAISNDRILKVDSKEVTFSWHDYAKNYQKIITTLSGEEFLHRFCQHILPSGFTRIRHYGFLSSAAKNKSLEIIRKSLKVAPPKKLGAAEKLERALKKMGIKPGVCSCGGAMKTIKTIPNKFRIPIRAPPFLNSVWRTTSCNTTS